MTQPQSELPWIWGVGIEDTSIGWPLANSATGLDEYELTGHYRQYREDLALAASVGARAVRYGLPWYRVNPAPGTWDWSFADAVVDEANRLGLDLIVDLVHYGTPTWLSGSFTDAAYPNAVAAYAGEVASRYRGRLGGITPLNEPLVTASFVGQRGIWPPYELGEQGWSRVIVSIAEGIQRSIRTIRSADPEVPIVHVEATHVWRTDDDSLSEAVGLLDRKNFLPTDLVLGRVDASHPMHGWLRAAGIASERLCALVDQGTAPDVIGLNYYPELSARELVRHPDGVVGVTFDTSSEGLRSVIGHFHTRYDLPILVTETAVEGDDAHRMAWLAESAQTLLAMREEGMPVIGMVWWPLFDFVDWSWATGDRVIEEFYTRIGGVVSAISPPPRGSGLEAYFRRMGLCRLTTEGEEVRRMDTPVAHLFQQYSSLTPRVRNVVGQAG